MKLIKKLKKSYSLKKELTMVRTTEKLTLFFLKNKIET
jgi:hypothetical protein